MRSVRNKVPGTSPRMDNEREKKDIAIWKGDSRGVFFIRGLYSLPKTGCDTSLPLKII